MNDLASLEAIFFAALKMGTPAERAAYLDESCAGDPDLRRRVEKMLAAQAQAGSFLEQPAAHPVAQPAVTVEQPLHQALGTMIGPYKLLQQIGEGGMGTVYMAEQTHPVHRKVALKVIKPGMDSRQVIARFEAERQALAMMDHVNIARVFDGGTTGAVASSQLQVARKDQAHDSPLTTDNLQLTTAGLPYFVMELVHGIPITKYCDDNHLTPRERLELFLPVCQAIQHAHQKGIIHRDVKPSNVMITLYDGKPVPKVIDFGVAKATEQKLTERTLFTQYGAMVGTFEYMSPEQAEMSALGVDTRSDIFSLGVLLYELLTGSTPLSHKRVKEATYGEILRLIKEEEPPKPSTRLSDSGEALASISAKRHMEPGKLTKLVRGELDWIVMKALEKDRNRRYETANGFAMDVQRYLADEPVLACPPSTICRLKKFVRRNKGPAWAAAVVLLTLVGGIVGTTVGLLRAEKRAEGERNAKQEAEAQAAETKAVLDFVQRNIFAAAQPEGRAGGLGHDVTLRRAIEAALPFVEKSFTDRPLIEARLRVTLGQAFHHLGDDNVAAEQFTRARAVYVEHLGPDHPDALASMNGLAISYKDLGRHADACQLHEETLALQKVKLGPDHSDTIVSMVNLATSYHSLGRYADACKLQEETLALMKAKHGPNYLNYLGALVTMNNLANTYHALGRHADACGLKEETLALMKAKLGPDHPDTLACMSNLAVTYGDLGRHGEALGLCEKTLALLKAKVGPDHPDTLRSMANLAGCYQALGRHDDACKLFEETLPLQKSKLGPDHPQALWSMTKLAANYAALGRHADAVSLLEKAQPALKAKLGPDHRETLGCMMNLANSYDALGRHAEALKLREETLARQKAKLGPDHGDTLTSMANLANSYTAFGRHAEALKLNEEALALMKATLGPDHPETLRTMMDLANGYDALDRRAEALRLREETLALTKARLGPDHPDTLGSTVNLAMSHHAFGRYPEAVELYEGALTVMKAKMPEHPFTFNCMNNLASSYVALGRDADALKLREETLTLRKAKLGLDHPVTLESTYNLADSLIACDRGAEAVLLIDECVRRADGKVVNPSLIPSLLDLRLRHSEKNKDAAGCRATAEVWERLNRTDAGSLYAAARSRAVTAAVAKHDANNPDATRLAREQADLAMAWLHKAVAAGFKDAEHLKKEKDLAALRERADFKKLLAELEAKSK